MKIKKSQLEELKIKIGKLETKLLDFMARKRLRPAKSWENSKTFSFTEQSRQLKRPVFFFLSFGCMSVDNSQILLPANKLDIQSPAVYGVYQGSRISTRDRKKRKQ